MAKLSELAGKLTEISTALTATGEQITKATQEIIDALDDVEIPAEAQTKLDALTAIGLDLKAKAQALDDLNPDQP